MERHEVAERIYCMLMDSRLRMAILTVGGICESLTGEPSWEADSGTLTLITAVLDDMSQDGTLKRIDAGDGAVRYEYHRAA